MPVLPRFHNPHNEGVEESFRQSSGGESASFTPSNDGMKFLATSRLLRPFCDQTPSSNCFFPNPNTQLMESPLRINDFYRTLLSGYPAGLTIAIHPSQLPLKKGDRHVLFDVHDALQPSSLSDAWRRHGRRAAEEIDPRRALITCAGRS
jgi:hypothetical protein